MKIFKIIMAIVLSLVAVIYFLLPKFTSITKADRDTSAVQMLRTMHNAQAQFKAMRGRFGTLRELADGGLLTPRAADGEPISGYVYSDANTSTESYCICANRANANVGKRDFNIIEDGEIRYHESETRGSAICGKGISLTAEILGSQ